MNNNHTPTQPQLIHALPVWVVGFTVLISLAPFVLHLAGFDFGNTSTPLNVEALQHQSDYQQIETSFHSMAGAFTHTLLEWTACCIALFTFILALMNYRMIHDHTTLVIALALLCAGFLDAFHTLAADRLIQGVADNRQLIPFTWAISRTFNALILIIGVSLMLFYGRGHGSGNVKLISVTGLVFGLLAFLIISYCAKSEYLPQTMYPDQWIKRPWDVIPLILFTLSGLLLFPVFFRRFPSIFAATLVLSMVPDVATELHMAFGSRQLFDNHFNSAHFLKIIGYLIPLLGLILDYQNNFKHIMYLERRAEDAERFYENVFETVVDGMVVIDQRGLVQKYNPAAEALFGYSPEEVIGENVSMLMPSPYREAHDGYLHNYMTTGEKKIIGIGREVRGLRKDGTEFPMELSVSEVSMDGVQRFVGIVHDISERKEAEATLEESSRQLLKSNKELEDFAYIASHDLQEPLRMVSSYLQLLEKRYGDKLEGDALEYMNFATNGAKRMQELIRDLLNYSRLQKGDSSHFTDVNMQEVCEQVKQDLAALSEETGSVIEFKNDMPTVFGDRNKLRQLMQNLVGNALKYRDPEKLNNIQISANEKNEVWEFCVADNGIGISDKHFDKIFVIFKRLHTHEKYPGNGIGLALCQRIVETHGGKMWVTSEEGQGSQFYFTVKNPQ